MTGVLESPRLAYGCDLERIPRRCSKAPSTFFAYYPDTVDGGSARPAIVSAGPIDRLRSRPLMSSRVQR
jgi:hypothetical protein